MAKDIKRTVIGERLYNLRNEKNVKQRIVAEEIGISRSLLGKYETCTIPPLKIIERFSDYYDVSCDYLLGKLDDSNSGLQSVGKKSTGGALNFSAPNSFGESITDMVSDDYDPNNMPNDVKMLIDCYLNADENRKLKILKYVIEQENGSEE